MVLSAGPCDFFDVLGRSLNVVLFFGVLVTRSFPLASEKILIFFVMVAEKVLAILLNIWPLVLMILSDHVCCSDLVGVLRVRICGQYCDVVCVFVDVPAVGVSVPVSEQVVGP